MATRTPTIGPNFQCPATPNTAVDGLDADLSYGFIQNPFDAPGDLWVDMTQTALVNNNGTAQRMPPGWTLYAITSSTLPVSVVSTFANHLFVCIQCPN